jgi:hypothetical protein
VVAEAPARQIDNQAQLRQTDEQRRAQLQGDLDRANDERRQREQQLAVGRDQPLPLDHWQVINVGGEPVSIKIHDNDVTSFDLWINGVRRGEVKKEKGITGSGTDEILIYNNGRAALYYVWEISKLGHCMLRIRDA